MVEVKSTIDHIAAEGTYHSWCFVAMIESKGSVDYSTFKARVSKAPGADEGR